MVELVVMMVVMVVVVMMVVLMTEGPTLMVPFFSTPPYCFYRSPLQQCYHQK